jgi:basic membrane protein A
MKKTISVLLAVLLISSLATGCNNPGTETTPTATPGSGGSPASEVNKNIGMITNGDTVDDHAFNANLWKGLARAGTDFGFKPALREETGFSTEELLGGITSLYDAGTRLVFCNGMGLIEPMTQAKEKFKDLHLVMIDAVVDEDPMVVSTSFDTVQAGYIAGIAASVEIGEGEFGFLGGMTFPSVQTYNWGFQQGILHANEFYGTSITIKEENVVYAETFSDFMLGQKLAGEMYDRGVSVILVAAGQTGMGAIEAAKGRAASGNAWIIGVDFDQYGRGMVDGKSVILTSAIKRYDNAAYEIIKMYLDGNFPGGSEVRMNASYKGIGIPDENPNLSQAAVDAAAERLA